jgi:D-alanyl-D-alanine carboxypeptidase
MKLPPYSEFLQDFCNRLIDQRHIHGCIFHISDANESHIAAAGNLHTEAPYFIASTTKLFTSAIILQLLSEGKLELDHKIDRYLAADIIQGLLVIRGKDLSSDITIRQLLSQTSGLADYFEGKIQGHSLLESIIQGKDQSWTITDVCRLTRAQKPAFSPGNHRKAFYSDTNYQLLGMIIEGICQEPFDLVLKNRITDPLKLHHTYMYRDAANQNPALFYFKKQALHIPKAMSSFGPDGGMVSTAADSMVFIRAFFNGQLFPKEFIHHLYDWRRVMFPLQYGVGVMKFQLPAWLSFGKRLPTLIGHSGLCGAFAFYCPDADVYMTGTVNQLHKPGTSFKAMLRLIQAHQKRKKLTYGRSI